jgi:hypothetical protein
MMVRWIGAGAPHLALRLAESWFQEDGGYRVEGLSGVSLLNDSPKANAPAAAGIVEPVLKSLVA